MEEFPVLLDFGAGIIRHEAFAELEGFEFADDIVHHMRVDHSRPSGGLVMHKYVFHFV